MGLCKCPKRQVTNQFCYEHRVNVCENCMVQSHQKCIVQSYLQWLRDSDYVSNCSLCSTTLEQGDCVRLVCFHVFHWDCLNARQSALPSNTAPRGHLCPICDTEIFPTSNLVSPVADVLKSYLSKANWGRNGLGLALLSEDHISSMKSSSRQQTSSTAATSNMIHHPKVFDQTSNTAHNSAQKNNDNNPHSVLLMDAFNPPSEASGGSRRPLLPRQPPIGGSDRDDNKYRRRTPAEIFSRWSRRLYAPSSRPPWRRTWFLVISGVLAFVVLIYLMAAFGRSESNNLDDSWNDPNPKPVHHFE